MSVRVSRALPRLVVLLLATMLLAPSHVARATALDAPPASPTPSATPVTLPAQTDWKPAPGSFRLTPASRLVVPDPKLRNEAETFIADLSETQDRRLPMEARETKPRPGDIVLRLDPKRAGLGAEGYELRVGPTIEVTARTATGAFWGTRTVLQLLRGDDAVPAGSAVDVPKYAERGVGVCACYIHVSMPWLERTIKDAAYLKLNQLWLEIKVKSKAHPEANQWGYYTPDEIARLQRLADKYHVTLVPEVNSPGHIDPWIANRPDLQLTDSSGAKQPSRLDVTKPEAFDFLTSIIDEYFKVFRTPYWHMGADEYMLGSDYAKYPQLAAYAKEKFGADAVPQDAFIDFINRIDAYVKSKGKTLRIWNDGITSKATIPLNTDIVVEHWIGSDLKPSELVAAGHPVQNAAYSLYNVRGGFKSDTAGLYTQGWTPQSFEDGKVASPAGITGAKITLWPDNGSGNTENEIEDEVRMSMRHVAQSTWGEPNPDPTYAAFEARADAVGRAPGFANVDRTPVQPARYELAVGDSFLTGATSADGAPAVLDSEATAFRLATTPDGYYTVKDPATGRCLESRQGARQVNVPLQPGTPISLEACSASNRLQRWQLAPQHGGVTLTNAITQMVAVVDGSGGLVQQVPDGNKAQVFQLVGTVDTTERRRAAHRRSRRVHVRHGDREERHRRADQRRRRRGDRAGGLDDRPGRAEPRDRGGRRDLDDHVHRDLGRHRRPRHPGLHRLGLLHRRRRPRDEPDGGGMGPADDDRRRPGRERRRDADQHGERRCGRSCRRRQHQRQLGRRIADAHRGEHHRAVVAGRPGAARVDRQRPAVQPHGLLLEPPRQPGDPAVRHPASRPPRRRSRDARRGECSGQRRASASP